MIIDAKRKFCLFNFTDKEIMIIIHINITHPVDNTITKFIDVPFGSNLLNKKFKKIKIQ